MYNDISYVTGIHEAGIVKVQVAPREWLDRYVEPDFLTNNIRNAISFIPNAGFIELGFIHTSYEYAEKPKTNKNGNFKEVSLSGILNALNPDVFRILETLEYHEVIALVTDVKKQQRLIGNKDQGMSFSFASRNANLATSSYVTAVDMVIETESVPPYYGFINQTIPNTGFPYYIPHKFP